MEKDPRKADVLQKQNIAKPLTWPECAANGVRDSNFCAVSVWLQPSSPTVSPANILGCNLWMFPNLVSTRASLQNAHRARSFCAKTPLRDPPFLAGACLHPEICLISTLIHVSLRRRENVDEATFQQNAERECAFVHFDGFSGCSLFHVATCYFFNFTDVR
jgi:hypothetical protein